MSDSIYLAASSMSTIERLLETSTYNTVNASTPGFQRNRVLVQNFGSFLENAGGKAELIGARELISFEQGELHNSESPLALALEGDGFFVVRDAAGKEYLTRNGDFTTDSEGRVRTRGGLEVVSEGGGITVDPLAGTVFVDEQGAFTQADREIGRVRVVELPIEERAKLRAASETLYEMPAVAADAGPGATVVRHGYLEMSRYTGVQGMVEMLIAKKNHESIHRALEAMDQTQNSLIDAVR